MVKLVLSGNKKYISRMFKHLKQEHPSVRKRIIMIKKYKGGKK